MANPWAHHGVPLQLIKLVLPHIHRFNIRKDFLNLKKQGKMINSESFGFLYIKNENKFNFIVSTKISKNAVDRNLIRRRLSEITRELLLTKNISGVFLTKKIILNKTYKELRDEVVSLINKL